MYRIFNAHPARKPAGEFKTHTKCGVKEGKTFRTSKARMGDFMIVLFGGLRTTHAPRMRAAIARQHIEI
jgi:hypothetical protein